MNEFLEKWSEYEPDGSGFIKPEYLAFMLYEMNPPLGIKDDNVRSVKP